MKLNLNKLYVVYKPTEYSEKVDVFDGRPDTLAGMFRQVLGGLKESQVHAIYTTAAEADKEANELLSKRSKPHKKSKLIKRGEGYAIFTKDVPAKDRYHVQSKPKVYATRKEAEQALAAALKQGWKKSELKILKY